MKNNKFKITSEDLDNLREVLNALHFGSDLEKYGDESREIYHPAKELHPDPGHPSNRISPILNSVSVTNIGVNNIDGLVKLFMTIQCDDRLKVQVDKARNFLMSLIYEQVVTDWKPVFPGLRSRRYFRFCMEAVSKDESMLLFYHGKWRPVTSIEEQSDSDFAVCSFVNPYSETREARPFIKVRARYDSLYIITSKELKKLLEARDEDNEFFVQWFSAAMNMARAQKEYFINIEGMYRDLSRLDEEYRS